MEIEILFTKGRYKGKVGKLNSRTLRRIIRIHEASPFGENEEGVETVKKELHRRASRGE